MVIIQVIRSTWTKQSRGHPGSVARAAVPEALRMDEPPTAHVGRVVIETVKADEYEGFALRRATELQNDLPIRVGSVLVEDVGEGDVRVTRGLEVGRGWPTRDRDAKPILLHVGESCRLIRNHRFSGYYGWSYKKVVVNVANLVGFAADTFTAVEPLVVLDEQAALF